MSTNITEKTEGEGAGGLRRDATHSLNYDTEAHLINKNEVILPSPLLAIDNEILMSKGKYSSSLSRYMKKMQPSCRGSVILFALLVMGGLIVLYLGNSAESVITKLTPDKDRSDAYNVKVLPASLDDAALDALPKESFSYLAMIDAGSSGCRAHVFRYGKLGSIDGPMYVLPQHLSRKVKPGLSSFAKTPNDAGVSLKGLVDFVKEQVPESDWATTPIWLKATAGLRMLEHAESSAVLTSVRAFLGDKAQSPFLFRTSWARIISGNEEGGFGWIAYNYLKKIIGPKRVLTAEGAIQAPYAVVEMGGASSQVSQLAPTAKDADAIPPEFRCTL